MVPELGPKPKCAVNSFWLRKLLPALISRTISSPTTLASGSTVMNAPMPSRLEAVPWTLIFNQSLSLPPSLR